MADLIHSFSSKILRLVIQLTWGLDSTSTYPRATNGYLNLGPNQITAVYKWEARRIFLASFFYLPRQNFLFPADLQSSCEILVIDLQLFFPLLVKAWKFCLFNLVNFSINLQPNIYPIPSSTSSASEIVSVTNPLILGEGLLIIYQPWPRYFFTLLFKLPWGVQVGILWIEGVGNALLRFIL